MEQTCHLKSTIIISWLSVEKYADFIEGNRIEDPVERLKVLKRLVRSCIQPLHMNHLFVKCIALLDVMEILNNLHGFSAARAA